FFFFQAEDGIRDGHVTGVQTCALPISGGFFISCPAVEIDAERQGRLPILPTKLGNRSRKNSGQNVARSAFGLPRASGGVHEGAAVRCGQNRVKSLKNDVCLPSFGCLPGDCQSVCLHGGARQAEQPGHLTRMWRQGKVLCLSLDQILPSSRKCV